MIQISPSSYGIHHHYLPHWDFNFSLTILNSIKRGFMISNDLSSFQIFYISWKAQH